jgi:hypothetical protein
VPGVDRHRVTQEAARQRDDRVGHGRREEHRLPLRGDHRQDLLDVLEEAQVEHAVGLVEHERPDRVELELLLLGQVEQPAGRADENLDALLQHVDLGLVGHAAVDREDADAAGAAGCGEVAGHLQAQLTSGDDDEGLRTAVGALGRRGDALEHGQAEAEGLAGAGRRLADQVGAAHGDRQRVFLDGEGVRDAGLGQRFHGLGSDTQLGKGGAVRADRCAVGYWYQSGFVDLDVGHEVLRVPLVVRPSEVWGAVWIGRGPHAGERAARAGRRGDR